MKTTLTPQFIASAKAEPNTERSIYWDQGQKGFGLMVTGAGRKSFVVQYRSGKISRRMKISADLKLGEARSQARMILGDVAKGHDPLQERRKAESAAENTLASIVAEYFRREGGKLRTSAARESILRRLVLPTLGAQQIDTIRRSQIVKLLDKIEDANGAPMATGALACLRRVLRWHASRSGDYRSPIVPGMARTTPAELARSRTLSDDEIRAVWAAASQMKNSFGTLLRFLLLTATRLHEASRMTRSELDGDVWTIPAARYKNGCDHVVPLSAAAKAIVDSMPVINGSDWIFTNNGRQAVDGMSHYKRKIDELSGTSGWRLHDLRRTSRSLMSRAGVNSDHAERCMGHLQPGVKGVYDRHAYLDEKRQAFEALAALIERILDPPKDNVVALREASTR